MQTGKNVNASTQGLTILANIDIPIVTNFNIKESLHDSHGDLAQVDLTKEKLKYEDDQGS
jgi:hypothetical protein